MVCENCIERRGEQLAGEFLFNNLDANAEKEGVTLACCFSRPILVPYFFDALAKLDMPRKDIHLLLYDNTEHPLLEQKLLDEVRKYEQDYKSVRLYKSYIKGHGSITGSGNEIFSESILFNIWDMWTRIKEMIHTPVFLQFEDDTIPPSNAFQALMDALLSDKSVGMVTATATGRQSLPWIPVRLGIHQIEVRDDGGADKFRVLKRHSLNPDLEGLHEINSCGVFCFAARTEAYKTGFDGYDPNVQNVPFYAMDNILTWNITEHGWKILADFDTWCEHLQVTPARIIAFGKDQAIEQVDVWMPEYNSYAEGIEVKQPGASPRKFRVKKHARTWEVGDDGTEAE